MAIKSKSSMQLPVRFFPPFYEWRQTVSIYLIPERSALPYL
jgi:hypothetical protein